MRDAYRVGRRFEYRVIDFLQKQRWLTIRSAGSHGAIDILAGRGGELRAYQCQTDKYVPPGKKEALIVEAEEFGAVPWLAWRENHKLVMKPISEVR